jgi:hypothetical protein
MKTMKWLTLTIAFSVLAALPSRSVFAASPVAAYWDFDETSDTVVVDNSDNGNNAYIHGANRTIGLKDRAVSFSGSTDYAWANTSTSLAIANQLSIECWVNVRSITPLSGAGQTILRKENSYAIGIGSNGKIGFWVHIGSSWIGSWTFSKQTIQPSIWYHVVGVWNGQVLRVYLNGTLDANTLAAAGDLSLTSNKVYMGRFFESNIEGLNGTIDELKVYNQALSADTVLSHYNVMKELNPAKLVAHWSFDSVSGSTYYDITGHGYDAQLTGTGVTMVQGLKGNTLNCSGTGFEIEVDNSKDSFALFNALTIEAWYYSNINPATEIIEQSKIFEFSNAAPGVRNGYGISIANNGKFDIAFSSTDGNQWVNLFSSTVLASKRWYHLAGTYDGSSLRIYINGKLEGTTSFTGAIRPTGLNARIGCQNYNGDTVRFLANGRIDELKVYNYALSGADIAADYKADVAVPIAIPYAPDPTYNRRPLLQWYKHPSIAAYRLQVATSQNFSSPFVSVPTSDTFYLPTVNLPAGVTYWRVGNDADSTAWSDVSSLSIQDSSIPMLIPYTPDPTRSRRPELVWHPAPTATSYTIQIHTAPSFTSPFISDAVTDTFYVPSSDCPVGTVYWRVKSNTGAQYSLPDTFVILNDSIPYLVPMKPDTQYVHRPLFMWYTAAGAASYRIQIDTVGNFSNPYISVPVPDTNYSPSADIPLGRIYWRVSASSNFTRYSMPDTFLTMERTAITARDLNKTVNEPVTIGSHLNGLTIAYSIDKPCTVKLTLYSLTGSTIATRISNESPGSHVFVWQFNAKKTQVLPYGTYIALCRINETTIAKRIFFMK